MFRKVNAREKPIGFYHTGPTLRSSDLEISELFKRFVPKPVSLSLPSIIVPSCLVSGTSNVEVELNLGFLASCFR